jgi:hypothetical protein
VVEVLIHSIEDNGNINRYPSANEVLNKKNGKWKLTGNYAKYELIIL